MLKPVTSCRGGDQTQVRSRILPPHQRRDPAEPPGRTAAARGPVPTTIRRNAPRADKPLRGRTAPSVPSAHSCASHSLWTQEA